MAKTQEWLTGCPCCGTSDECDCDLSDFYAQLDKERIEVCETQLAASQAHNKMLINIFHTMYRELTNTKPEGTDSGRSLCQHIERALAIGTDFNALAKMYENAATVCVADGQARAAEWLTFKAKQAREESK